MSKLNSSVDGANSINHMNSSSWSSINAEYVARMRLQNQFKTGIEIAKYTASIMRKDMESYDNDSSQFSLA